jgi:hypothetical protein
MHSCSVPCFKKHKETPCQAPPVKKEEPPRRTSKKKRTFGDEDDKPAFAVTEAQYARLGTLSADHVANVFHNAQVVIFLMHAVRSEHVRKTLDDRRVQALCEEIAEGGEKRLKQALKDDEFAAFMDEILKVIGMRDEEGRFIL